MSSVGGCFEFYPSPSEEILSLLNRFCPCAVGFDGNISFFDLAAGGEPKRPLSVFIPSSFYFEYLFYCILKSNDEMYYDRHEIAARESSSGHLYTVCVPAARACDA